MANRHLSRSIALQTLFEWDFNGCDNSKVRDILNRNVEEFGPGMADFSFVEKIIEGVVNNKESLDDIIKKAAPEWPLERIATTDRNVLRIGLYELLYSDRQEVPAKVAINESIELAKTFGGENSGKFINGVLGTVYKEIGEPGKDEVSKISKGKKGGEVDLKNIPVDNLCGAVVYAVEGENVYLALVHDVFGYWTLSKGKVAESEDVKSGAVRKVKEEIGLDITITGEIGSNEYIASDPERGKVRKKVTYFLAESTKNPLKLKESGGLDDAKWFKAEDIQELKTYNDMLPIITKGLNMLAEVVNKPQT